MKLRNKGLVIIGSSWALFLALNCSATIHDSLLYVITLGCLFALSTWWLIQTMVIKQADQLNKKMAEIAEKNNNPIERPLSWLPHDNNTQPTLHHSIFFNETINKAISHAKRRNKLLAVLLIAMNPAVNSRLQPLIEESALKEMTNKLATTLRHEDIVAKLEGNVLGILLNDIGKAKFVSAVANKILLACAQPIKIENRELFFTANIGICVYPTEGASLEDLLRNADVALSKAKNAGINTFRFHTQAMDAEASEYIHLEKSLRKAVTHNELALYYQPKIHLKTGETTRIEALIRWVHPEIGVINPAKFLPIAEETDLIYPIGEWAIREACKMNKQWQNAGYAHMPIAVNLSPKQFYHPDIAHIVAAALKETGLNPNYLELEVTETAMMDDARKAINILENIKTTGVQISIDHFGVGYFSISQLKQFPLTLLKIDHSFIKGVPNNPNDSAIVAAMITLAHQLGLEVVAEGVETAEQVQYLSLQNCDMVQGYFLSPPLPAEQIVAQFKKLTEGVLL